MSSIFETMDYGTAPESDAPARAWIAANGGRFGHFIQGRMVAGSGHFPTINPADGQTLAQIAQATPDEVAQAVAAAKRAFPKWAALSCHARARYLYALARLMQKHARVLAVLETLDNGKPIRETRDVDIPLAIRHFYYHAGLAQLRDQTFPEAAPLGVCAQIIPWNFPLLMLAWKIAPALAAGNTVVLKPAEQTTLSALHFAEICKEAGLPDGVVNIVTGDGQVGDALVRAQGIAKVAFTGSTEVGRLIRQATAGRGVALGLELGGKSPYLIFEDADLDSAVEGLVDAIWFNQGQVCCAGSRLLVQESVAERVYAKIRARMAKLRVGDPLDKSIDIGAMIDAGAVARVREMVAGAGACFVPDTPLPDHGAFLPPMLITGLAPAHPLMQEEIFGPVLVATTFRTPDEAVSLANNSRYGLAASVWSESISLALEIAPRLVAGVVWVNGTNMFDASAPFGGLRHSGFGREGGPEGLRAYLRAPLPLRAARAKAPIAPPARARAPEIDRTAKLWIGGQQVRPDGGQSAAIYGKSGKLWGHIGLGGRKDIRNAVEAARAAGAWAATSAHNRAQVLYFIAENLSARQGEMADALSDLAAIPKAAAEAEVALCLSRLFSYGAWADKFAGEARAVPMRAMAMALREAVGVIGVICPDEALLAAPISLMASAIAMGNRVVLLPSWQGGVISADLMGILQNSDLPDGVVNLVTGQAREMARDLALHSDVDAIWNFNPALDQAEIETASAHNLKRVWSMGAHGPDWLAPDCEGAVFLEQASEVKTVWIPYGV